MTDTTAVAAVKAWMVKHGYSTGGGDNIGYLLTTLESQIWDRVCYASRSTGDIEDGYIRQNFGDG